MALVACQQGELHCLKMLLDAFSSMTGLHINFDKSTFVPVNVQEEATNLMAAILSYPVAAFHKPTWVCPSPFTSCASMTYIHCPRY
jgi:hypothetical protein